MSIDPKYVTWFGVWTSILLMIAAAGPNFFDGALPATLIPVIVKWCAIFGAINNCIMTGGVGFSSNRPGPWAGIQAAAAKPVIILAIILCAMLLMVMPARAGDIASPASPAPAKAVSYAPCQVGTTATPLSCTGGYIGGGLGGAGSNANIIGNGINGSVFAGGITPTFDAGYQYVQGNWMAGGELDVAYAVGTGATVNGIGNGFNGFRISEVFKAGGNLSGLLGTQTPITIPPQLANSILAPYVHIGTTQWQLKGAWANGISSGAGVLFDISPRLFGDLRYTYTNFSAARSGGLTINDDNSILVTLNYKLN